MKTTEIFVEQVIIGFLVLFIAALPFGDALRAEGSRLLPILNPYGSSGVVAALSAAVVGAYLLGILCDRVLDTLLQDLERHNRLTVAKKRRDQLVATSSNEGIDPHPEHVYRVAILGNPAAVEYADYLRSRIRLTRAMTVLFPALGFTFLLFRLRASASEDWWQHSLMALGALYGLAFLIKLSTLPFVQYRAPKTASGSTSLTRYYKGREKIRGRILMAARETDVQLLVILTALGIILARNHGPQLTWIPVTAAGLAIVSGWCWWRISITFQGFLRDYWLFGHSPVRRAAS